MMNQVYKTLPDDRPIRALYVIEDVEKCPQGFVTVSKTYDQDSDADLWRESGFFGRKCSRYLCLSKTEGHDDLVVESLTVVNEKDPPPLGYKAIPKTCDSDQKAWRKRQLCIKFTPMSLCQAPVTDIIVLNRMKKAPEEFTLLGEINGMTLCYKVSKNFTGNKSLYPQVPYPVLPYPHSSPQNSHQNLPLRTSGEGFENGSQGIGADGLRPFRPAPKPPTSAYATLSGYSGLEGVPFILNPKFNFSNCSNKDFSIPKPKTKSQIDEEYKYEFRVERET